MRELIDLTESICLDLKRTVGVGLGTNDLRALYRGRPFLLAKCVMSYIPERFLKPRPQETPDLQADLGRLADLEPDDPQPPVLFEGVDWVAHLIAPGGTFGYIRKFARTYDIFPFPIAIVFREGIYEVKFCDSPRKYFFVYNGHKKEVELNEDWEAWRREFYEWVQKEAGG